MPWIYNSTPEIQVAAGFDGTMIYFPPRKKTYVKPEQMSAYVWNLVRERKLANKGGDPKPTATAVAVAPAVKAKPKEKLAPEPRVVARSTVTDTSSSHHVTHAKVANESTGKKPSRKKSKAEKKQLDIQKKEDTQGNSNNSIETDVAEKPKNKRKRTFKRKD